MDSKPITESPRRRQQLYRRLFWFVAGSVVNYALIATPFKWLDKHTDIPLLAKSALSFGVSMTFFFLWNYFVNFRTDVRKRDALPRYLAAQGIMWTLSSSLYALLKCYNAHLSLNIFHYPVDLDIVATQFFLAGVKFPLYHKWAFPLPKEVPAANEASAQVAAQ